MRRRYLTAHFFLCFLVFKYYVLKAIGMKKPIIVRLKGTNVNEAKKLIESSGIKMIVTDDLEDAASKAVNVADIVKRAEDVNLSVQVRFLFIQLIIYHL